MKDKTCEQRIGAELEWRMQELRRCLDDEAALEEYRESILEVEKAITYRVLLSWGGPSDFFVVHVDPGDRQITRIEYCFQDWFDGATRTLGGEDHDVAVQFFEWLVVE